MKTSLQAETHVPPEYRKALSEGALNGGPAPVIDPSVPKEYWWAILSGYAQSGGAAPAFCPDQDGGSAIGRNQFKRSKDGWGHAEQGRLQHLEQLVSSNLGAPPDGWGHGPGERLRSLEEFIAARFGAPPADTWGHGPGERLRSLEEMIYSRLGSTSG